MSINLNTIGMYKACIYMALEEIPLEDMMAVVAVGLVCPDMIKTHREPNRHWIDQTLDWHECSLRLAALGVDTSDMSFDGCNYLCSGAFTDRHFSNLKPMINRKGYNVK